MEGSIVETTRKGDRACVDDWQGRLVERVWRGGSFGKEKFKAEAEKDDGGCWKGWEFALAWGKVW